MIRKINNDAQFEHRWYDDVVKIQSVLRENNYAADLKDCAELWQDYSDDVCAGWMGLPEEEEAIWRILQNRVEGN